MPKLVNTASVHMLKHSHQQVNRCLIRLPGEKCQEYMLLALMRLKTFSPTEGGGDGYLFFLFSYFLMSTFNCCIFTLIIQSWLKVYVTIIWTQKYHLRSSLKFALMLKVILVIKDNKSLSTCFRDVGLATSRFGKSKQFCCPQHRTVETSQLKITWVTGMRTIIAWVPTLIHSHFMCWIGNTRGRTFGLIIPHHSLILAPYTLSNTNSCHYHYYYFTDDSKLCTGLDTQGR